MLANKEQITAAADLIAHHMQQTAQHYWPLLSRAGTEGKA